MFTKLFAGAVQAAALALVLVAAPLGAPAQAAEPVFPPLSGRVVDEADLIPPDREAAISAKLEGLEQKTGDQLVVVTVKSLQDLEIEDYGYQLGRAWGIGQKGTNNGVLFIIAPTERKTRIEVGYGLEPVLTDTLSSVIIQRSVLPDFRQGRFADGIEHGTDALIAQLSLPREDAIAVAKKAERPKARLSPWTAVFTGFIIFFVLVSFLSAVGRRGRRSGVADSLLPILIWSALDRRSGGWGGGGGGGWGGGGGGFSGGGGSFGGGGASGGW